MKPIGERETRDTGMALVLICLLASVFTEQTPWLPGAIVLLVLTMTCPAIFKHPARFWFAFSHHLGNLVSRVVLTVLFLAIVTPIGLLRRLFGADPLQLKKRHNPGSSAFVVRGHTFSAGDLERPY